MFNLFSEPFREVEDVGAYRRKSLNSAIYFTVTFILVSYTGYCWSASNAWDVGYSPSFSYEGMENLVSTSGWTLKKVAWVYLAPPLWGLLIAFLGLIMFNLSDSRNTHLQTFLFWLSVNGFMLYFSYVITGILSGQNYSSKFFTGFAGVYGWLEWSKAKATAILCLQGLVSLPFVLFYSKPVLQLNFSRLLATRKNGKPMIFFHVVLLPFLLGCLLLISATFPMDMNYQLVRLMSYSFVFVTMALGMGLHKAKYITIVKGGIKPLSTTLLSLLTLGLVLSRFVLGMKLAPLW